MKNFKGIFPALLTPFDKNDNVNTQQLKLLVERNIAQGADGFYVAGSTGEAFLLSEEERRLVYKTVKDAAGDKVTLIAHVGTVSTKQAVEYAKYVESIGYDAVSAVAPFYYKFSNAQVVEHYKTIADSVNIPLIIYNIPAFSGVELTLDEIADLLAHDNIIGVKYTSNDYFKLQQIRDRCPDAIIYNGFDEMMISGLAMGADGGIGSTYNFMTDKFIKIHQLWKSGDVKGAQEVQWQANKIITALCKVGVMAGEKAVLNLLGFDFGVCRKPFGELTDEQIEYLKEAVLPLL